MGQSVVTKTKTVALTPGAGARGSTRRPSRSRTRRGPADIGRPIITIASTAQTVTAFARDIVQPLLNPAPVYRRPREACELPDRKTLFVEHGAIRAPQLDSPLATALTADGVAGVCAVTRAGIGLDAELHGLPQAIPLIPAVLNRRSRCGFDLRVEEHPPW